MTTIYQHGSFFFFIYVCVACLLGMFGIADTGFAAFWRNFFTVAFEILVGAGVTIFFIDRLNDHRATESLKRRLIREAGSRSHDIAISAVEWMDREGWLRGEDGLLKEADLREARLSEARMEGANLEGVNLRLADLSGASLEIAILKDANLVFAKAKGSVLNKATLENAKMNSADLDDAYLNNAQLDNATLSSAKLRSAKLDYASFRFARMLNVDLTDAFTSRTDFFKANLHRAKLQGLTDFNSNNFEGATLTCVDLAGVDLENGNLNDADLRMADLRNSNLIGANLQGADLYGALLEGADFLLYDALASIYDSNGEKGADSKYIEFWQRRTFLSDAILPDGTKFSEGMDCDAIARFTDRKHPEFKPTHEIVRAIRASSIARIDWEMMLAGFGD